MVCGKKLVEVLRPHLTLFAGSVPQIGLLLLLSYSRCMWIISEALELRVLGERVSHSWCMGEVCHGYGDWFGAEMDVVWKWYACGENGVVRMSGDARTLLEREVIH